MGALFSVVLTSAPVLGQSAADVATARKLAQEGIELYGAGKYQDALDRVQRAEAIFDAPVHLLYIARCQAQLGLMVEASESYRKLARVELEANAPEAFREAVSAGKREGADVEAKVPALRLEIDPAGVKDLKLSIDGQSVPTAVVGVDRPANPGKHTLRAEAGGYRAAEASVELRAGEKQEVKLSLSPDPSAAVAVPPSTTPSGAAAPSKGGGLSFFVGLRLGGVIPAGKLYQSSGQAVAMSDYAGGGATAELQAGVRFARYFAAKLYLEGYAMNAGQWLTDQARDAGLEPKNSVGGQGFGLGAMVGTPPGQLGGFGELGITAIHKFRVTRDFDPDTTACGDSSQDLTLSGVAFRIGGGAHIPLSRLFQLTPYMLATFGQFTNVDNSSACSDVTGGTTRFPASGDIASGDRLGHQLIIIGVGGDLLLGVH